MGQDDRPHISYQNNGLSILKYAVWDGSGWRIEIVDSSNKPGSYNSLALDSGNRPHISYYEVINGDLKCATIEVDMQDGDGDGLFDYIENATCSDPHDADSDDDGISDGIEDANHNGELDAGETDPCDSDSDGDGIQDGTEQGLTSPQGSGTDLGVFVPDADPGTTTNPLVTDTDGDGVPDAWDEEPDTPAGYRTDSEGRGQRWGDMNGDGRLTSVDALMLLKAVTGGAGFAPTPRPPKPIYLDKYAMVPKTPLIRAGEALNWINNQKAPMTTYTLVSEDGLWENQSI
ncbi:MAG: hypothetical protein KAR25_04555, partial [Methanosarcinales archaeon]|nr:hypothetical protein [Methanosarcinales archaeon]